MPAAEGIFPKADNDPFYGSEANAVNYINVLAGENLTAGNAVYIKKSDSKAYKSDTGTADDIRADGVVTANVTTGNTAKIIKRGNYVTSGLTANTVYYLGATGAISATRSGVQVGIASSTTALFVDVIQDDRDAIGTIKPYAKSLTGVPSNNFTAFWHECDGTALTGGNADAESPFNGQTLPDLNTTQRFLRGASTSGGTGGADTHSHPASTAHTGSGTPYSTFYYDVGSTLPAYYQVVYIIKWK